MSKPTALHAEQARKAKLQQKKQLIKNRALQIAMDYLIQHQPFNDDNTMGDHYQRIDNELVQQFTTPNEYQLARQGFLKAVRHFNKENNVQLDEPIVPILAKRDALTIDKDWFIEGSEVSRQSMIMQGYWQRKHKFSANDYVAYILYSSIMFGGLNDIEALNALYKWLHGERQLHYVELPQNKGSSTPLLLIPLSIDDKKYGCKISNYSDDLMRYVTYIPDDISLLFLYALGNIDINKRTIKPFETLIKDLSNKLELTLRDPNKPQLSHLVKYANFHWRQLPNCQIDGAGSLVLQGEVKTTSLPYDKLINYNQEELLTSSDPISWQQLFITSASPTTDSKASIDYPAFSKNLIQFIQEALKDTKDSSLSSIDKLLVEFEQPNAYRLLGWVESLIKANQTNLNTISKYVGAIGREWLMLTMDESFEDWGDDDYKGIYEQIIISKTKDGRQKSVLQKDALDDVEEDLSDYDDVLEDIDIPDDDLDSKPEASDNNQSSKSLDELKINQSFTYGRLRAFHNYQVLNFGAPKVSFAWGENKQVIKASMVSPRLYHAMQDRLQRSELNTHQKLICQTVLVLAYRTGMRINEIAGIKLTDIEHYTQPNILLTPNAYRRLKSSSAKRRQLIYCLLKPNELEHFTQLYTQQKNNRSTFLFALGNSKQPLPTYFFSNLMRVLWDDVCGQGNHDFTFHSLRHTAISQLALVLNNSPLAQVMTDYTIDDCHKITNNLAGCHQKQGAWFALASHAGHLTCDTTFEHYIHTAHLLAGWQMSQANLTLPISTVINITTNNNVKPLVYSRIYPQDKTAYSKQTHEVELKKLRPFFIKQLNVVSQPLFKSLTNYKNEPSKPSFMNLHDCTPSSIFIDERYNSVIAFLNDIKEFKVNQRQDNIADIAVKHGLHIPDATKIYERALSLNKNKLLVTARGQATHTQISLALDNAFNMSIDDPDSLVKFIDIYKAKHISTRSYLKFGVKKSQHELLAAFITIGCNIIEPHHWQLLSNSEKTVTSFKRKYELNPRIMTASRSDFDEFEVRVVKRLKGDNGNTSYESSGVLKFVGSLLAMLVD